MKEQIDEFHLTKRGDFLMGMIIAIWVVGTFSCCIRICTPLQPLKE